LTAAPPRRSIVFHRLPRLSLHIPHRQSFFQNPPGAAQQTPDACGNRSAQELQPSPYSPIPALCAGCSSAKDHAAIRVAGLQRVSSLRHKELPNPLSSRSLVGRARIAAHLGHARLEAGRCWPEAGRGWESFWAS